MLIISHREISIHAAREGGDAAVHRDAERAKFQSTPPVKAATIKHVYERYNVGISIHAAREGGDTLRMCSRNARCNFNPRRP